LQVLITRIAESYNPAYGRKQKTVAPGLAAGSAHKNWFFAPVLCSMLHKRWVVLLFAGFGAVQVSLAISGLPGWQCPIRSTLGVRCPGCGMTTAIAMLFNGEWRIALQTHAFAPLLLIVWPFMLAAAALPSHLLDQISIHVAWLEQKTGITAIVLLSMVIYWLLRVLDFI
jgi:hypothetical protein